MNPRIDAFKASDKKGYILIVESDGTTKLSPYNVAIYRVTKNSINYLSQTYKPIQNLFGDMTGYSDLPKYVQTFINGEQNRVRLN